MDKGNVNSNEALKPVIELARLWHHKNKARRASKEFDRLWRGGEQNAMATEGTGTKAQDDPSALNKWLKEPVEDGSYHNIASVTALSAEARNN